MRVEPVVFATAAAASAATNASLPSLEVPECPDFAVAVVNQSVPDLTPFPMTTVNVCYDDTSIQLGFKALNETNWYVNASQSTNDDIWEYEVMEAFLYHGEEDPTTYIEYEISPANVTYQAVVFNPTKVRADGAPFDHFFVTDPYVDGFRAATTTNKNTSTWESDVKIPLALFDVDEVKGSKWRMNFFRTITSPSMYPNQTLGAWSPPDQASFHMSPFFGHIVFV